MKEHEVRLTARSHSYKDYDEMLKYDEGNNLYNEILNIKERLVMKTVCLTLKVKIIIGLYKVRLA